MKVLLLGLALVAACGPGLPCEGPKDCGGNACCFVTPTEHGGTPYVTCTSAPTGCAIGDTIEERDRRVCQTDDDCVAGGIDTKYTKCCLASVGFRGAHTCTSPGLCKI